jgi:hypothetical protein
VPVPVRNGIKAHSISEENTATKNNWVRRQVEHPFLPFKAYVVATREEYQETV